MSESEVLVQLSETNPEAVVADGFDAAVVGIARRCGQPDLAVYSVSKCISILMERDGISYDDAADFFESNVSGAWWGEMTPIWLYDEQM